jgi:hypothetical protein
MNVSVDAPARMDLLDSFEIHITLPSERGRSIDGGRVAITIGISPNARFEIVSGDVSLWEQGEKLTKEHTEIGFGVRVFEDMSRAIVRFDPVPSPFPQENDVRIKVRAWALGRVKIRWVTSGSGIGCPARQLAAANTRTIDVTPGPEQLNAPADCAMQTRLLGDIAAQISISADGRRSVRVGEDLTVSWVRGKARFSTKTPVFIVFAMPESVRFEGRDLLAILPEARAPAGIRWNSTSLRVFVPLHMLGTPHQGQFKIKPFKTWSMVVHWSIVANTACGEYPLMQTMTTVFDVTPGIPEVIIQDQYSLEKPDQIIVSNSGHYRLEIFRESYRVFDVETKMIWPTA